jgi:presenilin-like A22 family membrane protease
MRFVLKGNPQAGLPLLNGGTIGAYLVGSLVLYGTIVF